MATISNFSEIPLDVLSRWLDIKNEATPKNSDGSFDRGDDVDFIVGPGQSITLTMPPKATLLFRDIITLGELNIKCSIDSVADEDRPTIRGRHIFLAGKVNLQHVQCRGTNVTFLSTLGFFQNIGRIFRDRVMENSSLSGDIATLPTAPEEEDPIAEAHS